MFYRCEKCRHIWNGKHAEPCPECGAKHLAQAKDKADLLHKRRKGDPLTARFLSQSCVHDLRGEPKRAKTIGHVKIVEWRPQKSDMECCNLLPDGRCLFRGDPTFLECLVLNGMRCSYYEKAVIPAANSTAHSAEDEAVKRVRARVRDEYHSAFQIEADRQYVADDPCPICGGEKAKGKRYCDGCRKKARKESVRASNHKRRLGDDSCENSALVK